MSKVSSPVTAIENLVKKVCYVARIFFGRVLNICCCFLSLIASQVLIIICIPSSRSSFAFYFALAHTVSKCLKFINQFP